MTIRNEWLRDFKKLTNVGVVKFLNNNKCTINGYGKITNGNFTHNRVAYVKGLKHHLISVSRLVVGTRNQMLDKEGSLITQAV